MTREPKYYRARINAIRQHIFDQDAQAQKWLSNGFIPDRLKDNFEGWIEREMRTDNSPLTFTELTTFSTWFDMHPEKVAGTMQGGTSMFFPVVVKGTKADCERMFADALANAPEPQPKTDTPDLSDDEEMEMLELEAEALQLAIKLKLALLDDEPKTPTYEVGDIVYVTRYTTPRLALIVKDYGRYVDAIDITAKGDGGYIIRIQNKHFGIRNEQLSPVDKALQAKIRQSIGEDEIDYFIQQSNSNN